MTPLSVDWNPTTYDRLATPHREWAQEIINRLPISPSDCIVDAGCGTGYMTSMVAERVPFGSVIAVDIAPKMLEFGIKNGKLIHPHIQVVNADLLEFRPASPVDGIFSNAVFHWILNQRELFSNLFHCLKPHGWLASQSGGGLNLRSLLTDVFELMSSARYAASFAGWAEPWVFVSEDDMRSILSSAGFDSITVWLEPRPVQFDTVEEYCQYLKEIVLRPYLARLSPHSQDDFLAELGQRSLSKPKPLEIDYHRINLFAKRP